MTIPAAKPGSRTRSLGNRLASSLWPIPLAMFLAGIALVRLASGADALLAGNEALDSWWLRSGNGGDARDLLTTLATAIITMASVVLSMTVVTLSLGANQFGTRLVRTYMRDRLTKIAIGFFLLTIVFCLLALRTVSEAMEPRDVPRLTVTFALVLSIACTLLLVLFLHRVATSIVADEVIRRVSRELDRAIDDLPHAQTSAQADAREAEAIEPLPADFDARSGFLKSSQEGYIQEIDYEQLAAEAAQAGLVLRVDVAAGDYTCKDGWLGRVYPVDRCPPQLVQQLQSALLIGGERTPIQDLAYSMRHLVDVALRALSPGINDANTALVVIDRLRGALSRLLGKALPHGVFFDAAGKCVLRARRHTHGDILALALRPIRDAAARQPLVIVSMLQALGKLAEHAREPAHAEAILQEAALIAEVALHRQVSRSEKDAIEVAQQQVRDKLALAHRKDLPGERRRTGMADMTSPPSRRTAVKSDR